MLVDSDNHEQEDDARLRGVVAMLTLPPVRGPGGERNRHVEIEVSFDRWEHVTGIVMDASAVVFIGGMNGTRREWRFLRIERMPRWRVDHGRASGVPFTETE